MNRPSQGAADKRQFKPDVQAAALRGYIDYAQGLGYPAEYELWSRKQQLNYENGRLGAANIKLAFGQLPRYRKLSHANYLRMYAQRAASRLAVGSYKPVEPVTMRVRPKTGGYF